MSRNNDVFSILVTKDNQGVLAAGSTVSDLQPGQIGVFDFDTNVSLDGSETIRDFYLAVGIDVDGDGVTDDIAKSAGSHIQGRNIRYVNNHTYEAGAPMIFTVSGYSAKCETEYSLKLELRNQEIYRTQGYNQFTKTYTTVTGCCDDCAEGCYSGDANEITKNLKLAINTDEAGLVTAEAIARDAITIVTHGTSADYAIGDVVSDADVDVILAFNEAQPDETTKVFTDLQVTTVTQKLNSYCAVNLKYFYPRETVAIPSLLNGFSCNGEITVDQAVVFEQGSGYDVKQLEYVAKGWTESPYRVSTLNGVADEKSYNTVTTEKYDMLSLTYDQFSVGAWLEYLNNEATVIAIPTADAATTAGILAVLNAIIANYDFAPLT